MAGFDESLVDEDIQQSNINGLEKAKFRKDFNGNVAGKNYPQSEFAVDVSKGLVTSYSRISISGQDAAVSTTQQSIWPGPVADVVTPLSAAVIMTLSSSNATDEITGVGAQKVFIEGRGADYVALTETLDLNGQTAVNTFNSYITINRITVIQSGATNWNVGVIHIGTGTVTAGIPAVTHNLIEATIGGSRSMFYTTADDEYIMFTSLLATVNSNKIATITLCLHDENGNRICGVDTDVTSAVAVPLNYPSALIGPKMFFEWRASVDAGTGKVSIRVGVISITDTNSTLTSPVTLLGAYV